MSPNTSSEHTHNPNEHLEIPKWINEDYFQHILEKDVPNYTRILRFTPVAATAPGENYTSIMVRVAMEIELKDGATQEMSYILKTVLDAGNGSAALISSMNLFPKEQKMYETFIPQYERLYKEAGVDIKLSPTCLKVEDTPERITLVMEDLKRKKFGNIDRLKGFDMPHIRCALRKLAELHAASAVYYELNGSYDPMYQASFFNESNRPVFEALFVARQGMYEKCMLGWGLENAEYYLAKQPNCDQYFDEAIRMNASDPNEFNVLNHGDCWSNNIMFNYKENGDIDETVLVDFQVGKWGTPAQDLWYMITTSAALDIKVKDFDTFIWLYHERLVECLKLLKYKKRIPLLKDLHMMMLKYGYWGPLTANSVLTVIVLPSDKDANMDNMMKFGPEGDEFRYKSFTNPYYAKAMCQLFPFFDCKGILDLESKA